MAAQRASRSLLMSVLVFATLAVVWAAPADPREDALAVSRQRMVEEQIRARGVTDPQVLAAMQPLPGHLFVPAGERRQAYEDRPLAIGDGQTISQPYMVALMTSLLGVQPGQRVLEVGTGSGYQAAVLSRLVREVYSIEIVAPLGKRARATLDRSEEHTSELQSLTNLVCRLLLEKKKNT